ncbi:hypothetical protein ACWEN6_13800 [Sphaerisporangium sp. NPDC004334]
MKGMTMTHPYPQPPAAQPPAEEETDVLTPKAIKYLQGELDRDESELSLLETRRTEALAEAGDLRVLIEERKEVIARRKALLAAKQQPPATSGSSAATEPCPTCAQPMEWDTDQGYVHRNGATVELAGSSCRRTTSSETGGAAAQSAFFTPPQPAAQPQLAVAPSDQRVA